MAFGIWLGGFVGFSYGGPLGMLAGIVLGGIFDYYRGKNLTPSDEEQSNYYRNDNRASFLFTLMVLSAHIIYADKKIMHSEMEFVRRFLRHNFSVTAEKEGEEILLRLFEQRKTVGETEWKNQIWAICRQIQTIMPYEQRLQLVAYLAELAKADRMVSNDERIILQDICQQMGLNANTAEQMMGLGGNSLEDAYNVLGISSSATDDEVRNAYKKMARENHPDKVASLGEDVRRAAEKKFQEIGNAKDCIYKARNMK